MNNNIPSTSPKSSSLNGHVMPKDLPVLPVAPASATGDKPGLLRRLAAQWRAPQQVTRGVSDLHDQLPRERDARNNPKPRIEVFLAPPSTDDRLLETTPLLDAIEVIKVHSPGQAAGLHHFYNHRVLPALAKVRDVVREEWERVATFNAEVERHNAALTARQADLETERDEATRVDREAFLALDQPLAKSHNAAAELTALAGGHYDPHSPSSSCVLRHEPLDLRVIAGRDAIPFPEDDKPARIADYAAVLGTGLIGTMIGASLGLMSGILHAARITSELPQLAGCVAIGIAAAFFARKGLKGLAFGAGHRYWMGHGVSSWGPWALMTGLTGISIVAVDAVIEQSGLLKLSMLQTAFGGSGLSPIAGLLAGVLCTFPYVVACIVDGYFAGRYSACLNRLQAIQEIEFRALDDEVRSRPAVQQALDAIARALELQREKAMLEQRIEATALPFDTEIGQCEAAKREPRHELDTDAQHRIQDAYDNWNGATLLFDRKFEELLGQAEPGEKQAFWQRMVRAVRGSRQPKGARRESSHRS